MQQWIKFILTMLVVLLAQMLILDNVNFMGYGTPLLYVWLVVLLPKEISPYAQVLWGFLIGTVMDAVSFTPGMQTFATTCASFVSWKGLGLFVTREDKTVNFVPSMKTMGVKTYIYYVLIVVLTHHVLLFMVEAFSLQGLNIILVRLLSSLVFTMTLIIVLEYSKYKAELQDRTR